MGLGLSSRALYIETKSINAAVAAAVAQATDERHPAPLARIAELLGEASHKQLLERMTYLDDKIETLLVERSAQCDKIESMKAQAISAAELQSENAALREREVALSAQVEELVNREATQAQRSQQLEQELFEERELTAGLKELCAAAFAREAAEMEARAREQLGRQEELSEEEEMELLRARYVSDPPQ